MNISEQVIQVLNEVAAKLGVAAEYLYPILLRQAKIDGIMGILSIFGFLILAILFAIVASFLAKKMEQADLVGDEIVEVLSLGGCMISGVFSFFSGIAFIIQLATIKVHLTALLNPDWYILEKLLMQIIK